MRIIIGAVVALLCLGGSTLAGPTDKSAFDPVHYEAQKVLYDFNFDDPLDGQRALGFIRNHIAAAQEFGDFEGSKFVVVAHGNELHAFSRLNRTAYPDVYDKVKELTEQGVEFHICRNAARSRGYRPDEFYDLFTVVPAAVIDIAKYENQGYSYMYPLVTHKMTRDVVVAAHPELELEE